MMDKTASKKEIGNFIKAHMSDSAVRNSELGNREPGEDQVHVISNALGIAPGALVGASIESAREAPEHFVQATRRVSLKAMNVDGITVLAIYPMAKNVQKLAAAIEA